MWFRRHKLERISTSTIAVEAAAYLHGSLATCRMALGLSVPSWAWLNRCAHGDLACLNALRSSAPEPVTGEESLLTWLQAERLLVDELMEIVDDDEEFLQRVQGQILLPLEGLLIEKENSEEITAATLVHSVRAALRSSLA